MLDILLEFERHIHKPETCGFHSQSPCGVNTQSVTWPRKPFCIYFPSTDFKGSRSCGDEEGKYAVNFYSLVEFDKERLSCVATGKEAGI